MSAGRPSPCRLQVLYVGGMPRSGSTLTDLLLHQLPGHVGVGELFYLWRNGLEHDGLCGCGERFSACPFWTAVGDAAYGGWSQVDARHVQALQDRVDRTASIPQLLARRVPTGIRGRRFTADLAEYTGLLRSLYAAIVEVSGAEVVVDSSKRPSLAYVLRTMPDVDLRVAQVVRDPRGVAFSFAKHVELPDGAALREEMPRSTTRKVGRRWLSVNLLVGALGRFGVPLVRIRYEDLVRDPSAELRRVLALSGPGADRPDGFDFVTAEGVRTPRTHVVAGGRIRLLSGPMELRLDDAWTRQMPRPARRLVEVMTLPLRRAYGYP